MELERNDGKMTDNTENENAQLNNDQKPEAASEKEKIKEKKKKELFPDSISLEGKSDRFKTIVGIALAIDKLEDERKKLKEKNKVLTDDCKSLQDSLQESEKKREEMQKEISDLKSDVAHRNEVIDIVKADKSESSQEYKNALAAALKTYYNDFLELKEIEMSNDIGEAMADTLEGVFNVLKANDIHIEK